MSDLQKLDLRTKQRPSMAAAMSAPKKAEEAAPEAVPRKLVVEVEYQSPFDLKRWEWSICFEVLDGNGKAQRDELFARVLSRIGVDRALLPGDTLEHAMAVATLVAAADEPPSEFVEAITADIGLCLLLWGRYQSHADRYFRRYAEAREVSPGVLKLVLRPRLPTDPGGLDPWADGGGGPAGADPAAPAGQPTGRSRRTVGRSRHRLVDQG